MNEEQEKIFTKTRIAALTESIKNLNELLNAAANEKVSKQKMIRMLKNYIKQEEETLQGYEKQSGAS